MKDNDESERADEIVDEDSDDVTNEWGKLNEMLFIGTSIVIRDNVNANVSIKR